MARLDERFYADSDGDVIPDFIEVELGYDPKAACAAEADCPVPGGLPGAAPIADQNVLVILDASGSMAGPAGGGRSKMVAAREAIERYVVGTPDNFDLGLMVYGHKGSNRPQDKAASCAGIETFAPLGQLKPDSAGATLGRFNPTGFTPIAASLDAAAAAFNGTEGGSNRVVLVTDGIETCDGDPVAAARRLKQSGVAVTVDVVGFDIANSAEEAALREVAEVTGGEYSTADTADQLDRYFEDLNRRQLELMRTILCVYRQSDVVIGCLQDQSLKARMRLQTLRDAEQEHERRRLLLDLSSAINSYNVKRVAAIQQQTREQVQELDRLAEEAEGRLRNRYGKRISTRFFCPTARHFS